MTDKELNSIGQWLNTKGYDLDLTDCFWMEDWIANETKFRDIAELLQEYYKEQLLIPSVASSLNKICDEHNLDIEDVLLEYDKKLNGFDVYYDEGIEVSYLVRKGFIQL